MEKKNWGIYLGGKKRVKNSKKLCLGVVESISRYAQHFTQLCGDAWVQHPFSDSPTPYSNPYTPYQLRVSFVSSSYSLLPTPPSPLPFFVKVAALELGWCVPLQPQDMTVWGWYVMKKFFMQVFTIFSLLFATLAGQSEFSFVFVFFFFFQHQNCRRVDVIFEYTF